MNSDNVYFPHIDKLSRSWYFYSHYNFFL